MLRQVYVLKENDVIYKRAYGNALSNSEVEDLSFRILKEVKTSLGRTSGHFDFIKYRIAYEVEVEINLIFLFITGLMDDYYRLIKPQLFNFKDQFINRLGDDLKGKDIRNISFTGINVMLDEMHRNLKPKIAVVGFAGVGKTTIKKLIKMDEIPLQHVPTITGEIATIKIGRLLFRLFDFAGQEQFKFLWKGFIKESDAVLVVTDSTMKNVEKSKFFINLINEEVPHARAAFVANKQDLNNAMSPEEIEKITGLKTYPMVANHKENRNKMIRVIADVLDMSTENSPLLEELFNTTDLSADTLVIPEDTKIIEETPIIGENEVPLNTIRLEKIETTSNARDKIDQVISSNIEIKPIMFKSGLSSDDIKSPIENALVPSDLFEELINGNSYTLNEKLSIIFTVINCAFLTKTNPEEYPKFGSFLRNFKMDVFNSKQLRTIRKFYSKIIKQVT
ncbi:MAG: ADP-ribosylation factor-like protein [Candidatus Hermodarchaeota archaeon]